MILFKRLYNLIGLVFSILILFNADYSYSENKEAQNKSEQIDGLEPASKLLQSQKALWVAHVLRDRASQMQIENLSLEADRLPVYLVPQGQSFRPLVKLKVKFNNPGWVLYLSDKEPVRKTEVEGEYVVYAYLRSRISTIVLTAVGPKSERKMETLYMFAPEAREYRMVSLFDSVLFSLGHSFLVYKQSTFGTFVSQSLLLGVKYISPEKGYNLGYFGDLTTTVYTYDSSPVKESPQFLDARLGLSYLVKAFKDPKYRSRVTLGVSTINLFSFGSPFGFSGLYGPNLGFRTEFYRSGKHSYAAEFQIAPYEFSDFLNERTIKLNLDLNKNLNNLRRAQFGLSYANHMFTSDSEKIKSDQINIYAALSF